MREKVVGSWRRFWASRYRNIAIIVVLVAAVPLTVFLAMQQQDIRQRAGGGPVTPPFPPSPTPVVTPNKIWGTVFIDKDKDGVFNNTDIALAGREVLLHNTDGSEVFATTKTNEAGFYVFENLGQSRAYRVTFYTPKGYERTTDNSRPIDINTTHSFGINSLGNTISGLVFLDVNRDGTRNNSDVSLPGRTVILHTPDGATISAKTITDASGLYAFPNLSTNQQYRITHYVPFGYRRTTDDSLVFPIGQTHNFGIAPQQ